jgi:hypothetical protein
MDITTGSSYPISSICAASLTTANAILEGDTVYKYTRKRIDGFHQYALGCQIIKK